MNLLNARPWAEFKRLKLQLLAATLLTVFAVIFSLGAKADNLPSGSGVSISGGHHGPIRADGHAPIGVMGDHLHKAGEWMVSYRFMYMGMEDNRIGTDKVSPEEIATTVPNRFFGNPGQPPTLRVVPTKMDMFMHMFGTMFAPTDDLTLMLMVNYVEKDMDHITFAGGAGTTRLGTFTTKSSGLGDTKLSGLYRLYTDEIHHLHLNLGVSVPTGSITESDTVLAPTGATPTLRLPYAMQLGSGTYDALPGVTYTGRWSDVSWGAQYRAEIRLNDENDEGYRLGDKHALTAWLAYQWAPWISTSVRMEGTTQTSIRGIDPAIVAPVQTADPDNYGGERLDLLFGVNMVGQRGLLKGHRFAVEAGLPVYQDLNGPQMETDFLLTVGWQKSF